MKNKFLMLIILIPGAVHCQTFDQRRAVAGTALQISQDSLKGQTNSLAEAALKKADLDSIHDNEKSFLLEKNQLMKSGGVDAGGGHVVSCQGKKSITLDYYNALVKVVDSNQLLNPDQVDPQQVIVQRLNQFSATREDMELFDGLSLGDWLAKTIQAMGPVNNWADADLKIIQDYNLIYKLPGTCHLEQGAAQEKNGTDIEMYRNSKVIQQLSEGQKKVLQIHEAFYSLVRWQLGTDSRSVRVLLEKLLLKNLPDGDRDKAVKNFIVTTKANAGRYVCQATGYREIYEGSKKFFNKNGVISNNEVKELILYGRTAEEAFAKLTNAQATTGYIPCNQIGYGGNSLYGICVVPPTLGENCK